MMRIGEVPAETIATILLRGGDCGAVVRIGEVAVDIVAVVAAAAVAAAVVGSSRSRAVA